MENICKNCGKKLSGANKVFCDKTCRAQGQQGEKHPSWKGGKHLHGRYVRVHRSAAPGETRGRYVYEHRIVAAEKLGRPLEPFEHVHHGNENPSDNREENLEVLDLNTHHRLHAGWEMRDGAWFKLCPKCSQFLPATTEFYTRRLAFSGGLVSWCKPCNAESAKEKRAARRKMRS